jgi:uncharacterized protein YutE (UPF0331/DUF86 family)
MEKFSLRVNEKVKTLSKWINQLEKIIPNSFQKYSSDYIISAASERLAEKIIEEMIIISNIILKEKGITKREKCFEILNDLDIISKKLSEKLEKIKGMRNLMNHSYDSFDEEVFYESLNELLIDSKKFIKEIKG